MRPRPTVTRLDEAIKQMTRLYSFSFQMFVASLILLASGLYAGIAEHEYTLAWVLVIAGNGCFVWHRYLLARARQIRRRYGGWLP